MSDLAGDCRQAARASEFNDMPNTQAILLKAADEIERLENEHVHKNLYIKELDDERKRLRDALALAWDALRWADSPGEGKDDEWSEIPTDRAQKAFDAVWMALGEKIHDLDALGADDE